MVDSAGRDLSSLSQSESLQLLEELRSTDSQGVILMEAFLDRRWQGWRNRNEDASAKTERKSSRGGGMTANEAYDVLGLKSGAKPDEIRAAHRRLMMKFHPDQGGSTYLAARINEAKEILLSR